ncbi:MAG: SDR family oxidoreductase [Nitriliruptoraceae bacterium]
MTTTVVLAGATGYLGRHLARGLAARGYRTRAVVRQPGALETFALPGTDVRVAQVTRPETLTGIMDGADAVISAVGITRQRDGASYGQVDLGANRNLLAAAERAGVSRFVYVGVLNGPRLRHVALCEAKERFVDLLHASPVPSAVIRPTGFFRDLDAVVDLARKGHAFIVGDGTARLNPVAGEDVAEVCVDALDPGVEEVEVGGPDIFSHRELTELLIAQVDRPVRIHRIPEGSRPLLRGVTRLVTPRHVWGPAEFLLESSTLDMVAPVRGTRRLSDHLDARLGPAGASGEASAR